MEAINFCASCETPHLFQARCDLIPESTFEEQLFFLWISLPRTIGLHKQQEFRQLILCISYHNIDLSLSNSWSCAAQSYIANVF